MLSTNFVLLTAFLYVVFLFILAFVSDRLARHGRDRLLRSPLTYTLSISVYCTSWTFYGAVGSAARNGLEFITIYLGPTLVFIAWWILLRKLVRIGHQQRITSIADLISSRFGKSTTLAVLVTLIAVIGTTPYIALQLKAVTTSFEVVSNATQSDLLGMPLTTDTRAGFWVAVAMAVFTILFGTRNLDANEHNPGVVAAIAFEALVKLFAIIAVGLFVVFGIAGGIDNVFADPAVKEMLHDGDTFGWRWINLLLLSAIAIICLPRQFQVTVVENSNENHLRTASWAFPLYLLLISLFVLPIAIVGQGVLPEGANPDLFVLTLPMWANQDLLALLAFIGGFSSATSMVIVASIALSIMISNHVVVPLAIRLPFLQLDESGDIKKLLLISRRISIGLVLMLGYLYFSLSARSDALASIGLIAFVGVAQFSPAIIGGLFWRNATATGAISGMGVGFVLWIYTLFMPSLGEGNAAISEIVEHGLFGFELLKPAALFGLSGLDPLVHAVFWSLGLNVGLFVLVSSWTTQSPLERLQSALFVDAYRNRAGTEAHVIQRSAATKDLYRLAQRILGPQETHALFSELTGGNVALNSLPPPDARFIGHIEKRLSGNIGAATARALVSQIATGESISLDEIIKLVDETQQVVDYSHRLEEKSAELESTAQELRKANRRLQELDIQKDEFLSQVSHEVRTPMTSIRSFAEILMEPNRLESEQRQRFINIIHEECLRLTRLLDEILEISRLEQGELSIELVPTYPESILERAIDSSRGNAEHAGVEIKSEQRVQTVTVMADADRLLQVLLNLFSNAIKYNTNEQPEVVVSSRIRNDCYEIDVADNGPGIADGDRVFDKFSRGREQKPGGTVGTGLGLSISRQLIINMGGSLKSVPMENGARFRISLPIDTQDNHPIDDK